MKHMIAGSLALAALALPAAASAADYTVTISNMAYGPIPSNLKVGDTITWINNDSVPHTITARDKSFNLRSDRGSRVRQTLTRAGTFPFFCIYHAMMRGVLKVAPSQAGK